MAATALSSEQDAYPNRPAFFACRFLRLLTKSAAAYELGTDGCWLLMVIAGQEDACQYRRGVNFYNGQLLPLCDFTSERKLIDVRDRCVKAGWLHYEPGARRRPGIYWVTIPAIADLVDSPVEEGDSAGQIEDDHISELRFPVESDRESVSESDSVNGRETVSEHSSLANLTGKVTGQLEGNQQGKCKPSYPIPIPIPNTNTNTPLTPNGGVEATEASTDGLVLSGNPPEPEATREKQGGETTTAKTRRKTPLVDGAGIEIPESLRTPEFLTAWSDWCDEKRDRGRNLTARGWRLQLNTCARYGPEKSARLIHKAIAGGWQGFDFEKEYSTGGQGSGKPERRYEGGPGQRFDDGQTPRGGIGI